MATCLIDAGVNVNAADPGKTAPLHGACTVEVAQVLLERGADANAEDAGEQTPLHRAQTVEIARLLIEHGAEIDAPARHGVTPPMTAVSAGRTDCVELLLEHGTDPNAKDAMNGKAALHRVALRQDPRIAEALLEHGAQINGTDNRGNTPLKVLLRYNGFDSYEDREATEKVLREWGGVECPHG